jgi:GNAT superfamily N-acetyltransferase
MVTDMATVRLAQISDAPGVSQLLKQLGYPLSPELVQQQIALLKASDADAVFVAENDRMLFGVISLHTLELFHCQGRLGRITSLVVDENHRGVGIGKLLIQAADGYFLRNGCIRAEVVSADGRIQAHEFYQSVGYAIDERRFIKRYKQELI